MLLLLTTTTACSGGANDTLPPPAELASYRFEALMETPGSTLRVSGSWVAPGRLYAKGQSIERGSDPQWFRIVALESAAWYDTGGGWQAGTNQLFYDVSAIAPVGQGFDPRTGVYPLLAERGFVRERVGEFDTRRFTLDGGEPGLLAALAGGADAVPEGLADRGFAMTIWVDEATGRIVRSESTAGDQALSWELSDLDDDRIRIDPPS